MLLIKISGLIFLTFKTQAVFVELENEGENLFTLVGNFLEYFGKIHHTINILSSNKTFLGDIYNDALKTNPSAPVTVNMNKTSSCNLIVIEDLYSFLLLFNGKSKRDFPHKSFYLVLLMDGKVNEIQEIFKFLWNFQIYNVNVMYQADGLKVSMVTFYPVTPSSCNNTTPVKIHNISSMENFFPNKYQHLHKCRLRVAIYDTKPYVFNDCSEMNSTCRLYGRDYHLLEALAKSLNFTFENQLYSSAGNLYENGTGTGVIKLALNNDVDLVVGDYFLKALRVKFLQASESYDHSDMIFIIPSGMQFTSLDNLIGTFSTTVWILVFVCFGFGFFVIFLVSREPNDVQRLVFGEKVSSPMMNLLSVVFGGSLNVLPRFNFARFLLMTFIMFCIVVRTTYTGSLYRLFQSNLKHNKVGSIEELIEKDFTIYAHEIHADIFKDQTKLLSKVKYNDHTLDNQILALIKNPSNKVSMVRPLGKISYFNQVNFYNFTFEICNERFLSSPVVIYYPKRFYLVDAIDKKLGQLKAGGLIEYWQLLYLKNQKSGYGKLHHGPKKLTMNHLIGSFQILFGLNCLAFVLFVVECIKNK